MALTLHIPATTPDLARAQSRAGWAATHLRAASVARCPDVRRDNLETAIRCLDEAAEAARGSRQEEGR